MKILLIEDHDLFRAGLEALLLRHNPTIQISHACDLQSGIHQAKGEPHLQLVLFDLGLPDAQGIPALQTFRTHHPDLPIIVLSGHTDRSIVIQSLEAGAMGFIPKTASTEMLWHALDIVLKRGVYVPTQILHEDRSPPLTHKAPVSSASHFSDLNLTQRQLDVFRLIIQGKPNKIIARDLNLAESTVKAHIKPILKALNVTTRVQAILEVSRLNITID